MKCSYCRIQEMRAQLKADPYFAEHKIVVIYTKVKQSRVAEVLLLRPYDTLPLYQSGKDWDRFKRLRLLTTFQSVTPSCKCKEILSCSPV